MSEVSDKIEQALGGVAQEESINSLIDTINGLVNTVNTLKSTVDTLASSPSGGGVKKVQRGSTTAAGTVTIQAVDMNKAVVYSVSKGSAGTVGINGTVNMNAGTINMNATSVSGTHSLYARSNTSSTYKYTSQDYSFSGTVAAHNGTLAAHSGTISGGTTNLTTKQYSAVLTSATTLSCDGPVEWQVVEYL